MAQRDSVTLDANDETFTLNIDGTERAFITMDFTSTITVTWTISILGGTRFFALRLADNVTAAAFTADNYLMIEGPCTVRATASGVSGGSCIIDAHRSFVN